MDGIGSRPRLRASGPNGDPLADRAYPIEAVADVPAAMSIAGAWLRTNSASIRSPSVIASFMAGRIMRARC